MTPQLIILGACGYGRLNLGFLVQAQPDGRQDARRHDSKLLRAGLELLACGHCLAPDQPPRDMVHLRLGRSQEEAGGRGALRIFENIFELVEQLVLLLSRSTTPWRKKEKPQREQRAETCKPT